MNFRKFYFVFSVIVSVFLFCTGIVFLAHFNTVDSEAASNNGALGLFGDIFSVSKNDPFNILMMVGDKSEDRTDTMMLVNYNPETMKISMLSIPRDTKVKVKGSRVAKINSAFGAGKSVDEGAKHAVDTVKNLLGVKIKYYVYLDIKAFRNIIDILDGVYFDVPADLKYNDSTQDLYIDLKKGPQTLNGEQAEQLLRFRKSNVEMTQEQREDLEKLYDGSDLKRIEIQQKFIKELIKQKVNIKYLTKVNDIIKVVFSNIKTNMPISEASNLALKLSKLNTDEINSFRLGGTDQKEEGIWYFIYNEKIVEASTDKTYDTSEILEQFFVSKGSFVNDTSNSDQTSGHDTEDQNTTEEVTPGNSTTPKATPKTTPASTTNAQATTKPNKTSTPGKNYTKNNPSNSETSVHGSTNPEP